MNKHSVSVAFQTDKSISAYGPLAKTVETYGFDGISVYNDLLFQPAWLPLLEIARHTDKLRLGPAAANPFTCHPINIAGNIALIDEMAHGRAYLGLARGGWLEYLGIEPDRPITAVREAFEMVRHLLKKSADPFQGDVFSTGGGESLRWDVYRSEIPFLLGTWGIKTMRACIRHISEVKVGGTANPVVVSQMRAAIDTAAAEVDRNPADIGLVIGAVTVVDDDNAAARTLARREAALYLSIITRLDRNLNLDAELLSRIHHASAGYDFEQVGCYISDDLLQKLTFAGTADEVAEQAAALFEAGANRIEFGTPHGLPTERGLRLLGERVLPALRDGNRG